MDRGISLGSGGKVRSSGTIFEDPSVAGTENTNLPLQDVPALNRDFTNPVLRWSSLVAACFSIAGCAGPPNLLTSTLNAAVNHPPFFQTEYPNPVLRVRTVQPENPSNFRPLISVTKLRASVATKFEPRKVQQPDYIPNLLTRILGQVQPPFIQTDQPNPLLRTRMVQPEIPFNILVTTLAVTSAPFYQNDQSNPLLRTRIVQPDVPANILVTTLAFTASPFYQNDQPNPVLRTRMVQPDVPANIVPTISNTVVRAGSVTRTWALPRQQPDTPPNLVPSLRAAIASPFYQVNWTNPVLRVRAAYRDTSSVFPPLAPNPIPFSLDNQPNPTLRVRTVQPENPTNLVPVQTTAPLVVARRTAVYTRIPPKPPTKTDIPPNIALQIYYFSSTPPFNQKVWPVHRQRFDLLSQVFDTTRYDTEQFAFKQNDWPNPVLRVHKGYLQDYTNRTTLVGQQVTQRRPATVPILRTRTIQPEIPINIRPLTGPPQPPFKQIAWLNPNLRVRTVQPDSPINLALKLTAPPPPFFLRNQPNPIMRLQGYWVFQFDRLNLSLQPAVWGNINDAQTPGWNATGDPCTVDSTIGTADTTLYTADMDCSATWGTINDSDTPGWTPIVDSQTPAWTPVSDTDTPGWTPVITDPGGSSSS